MKNEGESQMDVTFDQIHFPHMHTHTNSDLGEF